jgi:hypothetical protein
MDETTKNTTCWNEHKKAKKACLDKGCRQWINCQQKLNCTILASLEGPRTLQEIGDLHGLTRMRICQIEKSAIKKIKDKLLQSIK